MVQKAFTTPIKTVRIRLLFSSIIIIIIHFHFANAQEIQDSGETDTPTILSATLDFPDSNDSSKDGHPIFLKQLLKNKVIFQSLEWPEKYFESDDPKHATDSIVVVSKDQDGLPPLENNTYIVLVQSSNDSFRYTAHKGYIRTIDGQQSVEWDFYEIVPNITYKSFFTALSPTEYFQFKLGLVSSNIGESKQNETNENNMDDILSTVQESIKDATCFVAIFIPNWCEKHVPHFELDSDSQSGSSESEMQIKTLGSEESNRSSTSAEDSSGSIEEISSSEEIGSKELNVGSAEKSSQMDDTNQSSGQSHEEPEGALLESNENTESDSKIPKQINENKNSVDKSEKESSDNSSLQESDESHNDFSSKETIQNDEEDSSKSSPVKKPVGRSFNRKKKKQRLSDSTENKPDQFICPPDSGAVLQGDRCYCPYGTVLQNRKCLNKTTPSEDESESKLSTTPSSKNKEDQKLKEAEGAETNDDAKVKKRQVSSENSGQSFTADVIEDIEVLGPFYGDVLKINFNKEKASEILKKVPRKSLEFFRDRYKIGNNKLNGHPLFESKKLPFTGLMDCPYKEKKLKNLKGSPQTRIVDFFLYSLRSQCHRNLRKNTLKLFDNNIVSFNKNLHNGIVMINTKSALMNSKVLNKIQWHNFISAIYLAKFSEAFLEEKNNLDKRIQSNITPDRKPISLTARTLAHFVEKVMQLLKQSQFQVHAVKITKSLVMTISEYVQRVHKQDFILDVFCKECHEDHKINKNDLIELTFLNEYVMFGATDVIRKSLSFDEFYLNKIKTF